MSVEITRKRCFTSSPCPAAPAGNCFQNNYSVIHHTNLLNSLNAMYATTNMIGKTIRTITRTAPVFGTRSGEKGLGLAPRKAAAVHSLIFISISGSLAKLTAIRQASTFVSRSVRPLQSFYFFGLSGKSTSAPIYR